MLIRILLDREHDVYDLVDDSTLRERKATIETDEETIHVTEYCLLACEGAAHSSGRPDAAGHFCDRHVHRSVHVVKKKGWPELEGVLSQLG